MPRLQYIFRDPQRQASALHQRSVILPPVAETIPCFGFLVLHTSRLPAKRLRDYFCNKASPKSELTNPQSLTPNPQSEAEACFLKAIEIARRQQAKSLELRAVTSLSRLWQKQGKRAEAWQILAGIYGWFTEGFDTADLKEAKVLLDELA
jgi:hypothetical protein